MAETMGSVIDKLCIAELKIFHIQEQIGRSDLVEELRQLSRERLSVMQRQRDDLKAELDVLAAAKARRPPLPVILTTGAASSTERAAFFQSEARPYASALSQCAVR